MNVARHPLVLVCLAVALRLGAYAPSLHAQPLGGRAVTGTVVDARTGEPIAAAVVVLEPAPGGVLGTEGSSGAIAASRTVTTTADGAYAFRGLPAGAYRLRVSRFAYHPATVELEIRPAATASVSIGLVVDPVAMEPVEVVLPVSDPVRRGEAFAQERSARVALERERQARWLPGDVRAVTRHDVVDGVTLAESDLFRALQRLPGVTTRDDYTAELWTRGAPWSHTRVTFDGLPLFNPLHGVGVFSGVNSDAVGAAFFFPGARPASIGDGAAGVVQLASRPAGTDEKLAGVAEVSLVSARGTLDRGGPNGGWMVAARRSWLDLVTWAVESAGGGEDVFVPYAFYDVTARADLDLGGGRVLEASGLWMQDAVRGDVPDITEDNPSDWGNALARVTLETPMGGLRARHGVGITRFTARGLNDRPDTGTNLFDPPGILTDHEILHWEVSTALGPAEVDPEAAWGTGLALVGQRQRYHGPLPTPHPEPTTFDSLSTAEDLTQLALWVERRFAPSRSIRLDVGARLETGGEIVDAPGARFAPRLAARWRVPGDRATVSLAWNRAWQTTQALAPAGLSVGPRLHPNDLWFLAGDSIPALESDIATLSAEVWLSDAWLAAGTVWARRTRGITLPDPRPGPVVDPATWFDGESRAHGIDLSLRRLFGRWTTSLGYAWTRARTEVLDYTFPSSSERRHVIDAVATTRVGEAWRVGGAWRWASGAPFTRFFSATFDCFEAGPCAVTQPAWVEEPNAERGPSWSTLDLLAEWTRDYGDWSLALYGQVSNALNRENALTYQGSRGCLPQTFCFALPVEDEFERGLPILPVVGVRIAF